MYVCIQLIEAALTFSSITTQLCLYNKHTYVHRYIGTLIVSNVTINRLRIFAIGVSCVFNFKVFGGNRGEKDI